MLISTQWEVISYITPSTATVTFPEEAQSRVIAIARLPYVQRVVTIVYQMLLKKAQLSLFTSISNKF